MANSLNKYCKDCVHADTRSIRDEDLYTCMHPTNLTGQVSLVTGREYPRNPPTILRTLDYACGPEGKWHETHQERVARHSIKEPANPSLTLLNRLNRVKFDLDKL